jgi:hypothetical protein
VIADLVAEDEVVRESSRLVSFARRSATSGTIGMLRTRLPFGTFSVRSV